MGSRKPKSRRSNTSIIPVVTSVARLILFNTKSEKKNVVTPTMEKKMRRIGILVGARECISQPKKLIPDIATMKCHMLRVSVCME